MATVVHKIAGAHLPILGEGPERCFGLKDQARQPCLDHREFDFSFPGFVTKSMALCVPCELFVLPPALKACQSRLEAP